MRLLFLLFVAVFSGCATTVSPPGRMVVLKTLNGFSITDRERSCVVILRERGLEYKGSRDHGSQFFSKKLSDNSFYGIRVVIVDHLGVRKDVGIMPGWKIDQLKRQFGGSSDLYGQSAKNFGDWNGVFFHHPYFYEYNGEQRFGGIIQEFAVVRHVGTNLVLIEQDLGYSGDYNPNIEDDLLEVLKNVTVHIPRKKANQSLEPTPKSVTDRASARSAPAVGVAQR